MDLQEKREALVLAFVKRAHCGIEEAERFDNEVKSILGIEDAAPPEYLADALMFTDLFA